MEPHYVTIIDVAKYFNVSVSTVRGWIRSESIPPSTYLKLGSTYRFRLPEVEAVLRNDTPQEVEPKVVTPNPNQLELDFNPDEDI